jgi:CHAD domain-containing protein
MPREMETYAKEQVAHLLDRLAYQVGRAARQGDEETIHDLRVAIRRFTQSLRVFRQFLPRSAAKKIRRKLKTLMRIAAEVRNRDIAVQLMIAAGVPAKAGIVPVLREERNELQKALVSAIMAWNRRSFSRKWRDRLEL